MVLIISESYDPSTDKVMDWLYYKGISCARIHGCDIFSSDSVMSFQIENENVSFRINHKEQVISSIKSIWFRRDSSYSFPQEMQEHIDNEIVYDKLVKTLNNEYLSGKFGVFSILAQNVKMLGNFLKYIINKPDTLLIAKKIGIDIPATIITNSKSDLQKFLSIHGTVITKPISECFILMKEESNSTQIFTNFTEEISQDKFQNLPEHFYYSLFQENLDKQIEIRTFFLNGECFSMAIFSQMEIQTSIDFRKYSNNRNVPFLLPKDLELKINELMKELKLNTGSIDFVKTTDGRIVFLEVNPIGQYDMTSVPCNYHLDKKIAEYLIAS